MPNGHDGAIALPERRRETQEARYHLLRSLRPGRHFPGNAGNGTAFPGTGHRTAVPLLPPPALGRDDKPVPAGLQQDRAHRPARHHGWMHNLLRPCPSPPSSSEKTGSWKKQPTATATRYTSLPCSASARRPASATPERQPATPCPACLVQGSGDVVGPAQPSAGSMIEMPALVRGEVAGSFGREQLWDPQGSPYRGTLREL
jgi:hypothetical protein